jgi:hypothetical protein
VIKSILWGENLLFTMRDLLKTLEREEPIAVEVHSAADDRD